MLDEPETSLSEAALAILDHMRFDPAASYFYDHLAGGFVWSDEFPPLGPDRRIVSSGYLERYIIHIRRCITLGETELLSFYLWRQLEEGAPNWPGLRIERRTGRIVKRLRAAERLAERCYDKIGNEFSARDTASS